MPRRRSPVTQADLTRVAKAMRAAGVQDWQVEVEQSDGAKFRIVAGKVSEAEAGDDWDEIVGRAK